LTTFREPFPILHVDDVDQAIGFYSSTFGFAATYRNENDDGVAEFALLELEPYGIGVGLRPPDAEHDVALWIYTDDVDDAAERLRSAGATEVLPPTDQPWGERMCSFIDPNGHLIHIGTPTESLGDS
jgi:lactoylglutathione lyase